MEKLLLEIEKVKPDVVVMDLGLYEKIDGIETSRRIRSQFNVAVQRLVRHFFCSSFGFFYYLNLSSERFFLISSSLACSHPETLSCTASNFSIYGLISNSGVPSSMSIPFTKTLLPMIFPQKNGHLD
jgi:hypothetical protein